jgi:SOS regulatory protein LexA
MKKLLLAMCSAFMLSSLGTVSVCAAQNADKVYVPTYDETTGEVIVNHDLDKVDVERVPALEKLVEVIDVPESKVDANKIYKKSYNSGKSFKTLDFSDYNGILLPIYGGVPCGELGYLDDNLEGYVEIPESLIGSDSYFVLQADGDSMINAGINDEDLLIIRKQDSAEDGDIVVAFVDSEVTLKRYYKLNDIQAYKLHPENEAYDDKIVKDCRVLGVAIKILKDL